MMRARRNSTGFRFAGTLLLFALLPSFAPDTWGLSCLHHAVPSAPDDHDRAAPEHGRHALHERHAVAEADARGGLVHEPGAASTHPDGVSGHGSGHDDPEIPPCTCVGECPTSAGPPTPASARVFELPPAYPESVRLSLASTVPATGRVPYLLPFANAPPPLS